MLNSDEDVLNASISTLKRFENPQLTRNKNISSVTTKDGIKTKPGQPESSHVVERFLSGDSSTEIELLNAHSVDHQKELPNICSQFQTAIEALEVINVMYNFYHEKKSQYKDNSLCLMNDIEKFKDITSPSVLREQLEQLKTVLGHITAISTKGAKLKQVLRSNVLNEFWQINVDYHKSVVRFFTLAQEVTKDINQFITSIEKSKEHNPSRSKNIHLLETKLLAELHENLDILTEFRSYIQTSVC